MESATGRVVGYTPQCRPVGAGVLPGPVGCGHDRRGYPTGPGRASRSRQEGDRRWIGRSHSSSVARSERHSAVPKDLERDLGLYATITISIGAMVGSGIFVLPGLAAKIAGSAVILAYPLAGLIVLPAALSKAEMATAMPESGGTYLFIDRAMGPAPRHHRRARCVVHLALQERVRARRSRRVSVALRPAADQARGDRSRRRPPDHEPARRQADRPPPGDHREPRVARARRLHRDRRDQRRQRQL